MGVLFLEGMLLSKYKFILIQNVLFQGIPAPGDGSPRLTVADLAPEEASAQTWFPTLDVLVGVLATAPEMVRASLDGTQPRP